MCLQNSPGYTGSVKYRIGGWQPCLTSLDTQAESGNQVSAQILLGTGTERTVTALKYQVLIEIQVSNARQVQQCGARWLFLAIRITRRYSPLRGLYFQLLRRASASGRGFFCPSGKKRAFYAVLAYFRPFLVFSSNLSNFQQSPQGTLLIEERENRGFGKNGQASQVAHHVFLFETIGYFSLVSNHSWLCLSI